VLGGSRRSSATRPDSTCGAGQNTLRPTAPARRTSAYQRALTLGTPYTRLPGSAANRSATSACTMIRALRRLGKRSSMCSSTGTAMLYGRFATRAVGAGPGSSSIRMASACTSVKAAARAGARAAIVAGSAAASTGSTSTATTRLAASSRPRVSEPRPGPTSTTTSSGRRRAVATMRRIVFGSITKF